MRLAVKLAACFVLMASLAFAADPAVHFYFSKPAKSGAAFLAHFEQRQGHDLRKETVELGVAPFVTLTLSKGDKGFKVSKSRARYKRPRKDTGFGVRTFDLKPTRGTFKMTVDDVDTSLSPPPDTLLSFGDVLLRGVGPGYDPDDPQQLVSLWRPQVTAAINGLPVVLRTQSEYDAYMSAVEHVSAPYPTDIDFDKQMVFAVNGTQYGGPEGLDTRVRSVNQIEGVLVVAFDVKHYDSGPLVPYDPTCAILYALHVVALPKSDLPVRFDVSLFGPLDPCAE